MKNTKKALFTSIVSLMLCLTMLMGTTFAWFTDTATVQVSKITAGTLDIELWAAHITNGTVGEMSNIGDSDEKLWNDDKWEPGYTSYKVIKIVNAGNLAFEYALDVTTSKEQPVQDFYLHDVIDVYFKIVDTVPTNIAVDEYKTYGEAVSLANVLKGDNDGVVHGVLLPEGKTADGTGYEKVEEAYAIIALHMQESAGNDYQNLTENFDITLWAKQYTEEFDSETDQYDKNAQYETKDNTDRVEPNQPDTPVEPPVSFEALNAAISDAKSIIDAGNTNKYTDATWNDLTDAYAEATAVTADATQEVVDAAAEKLANAIGNLATLTAKTVTVKYEFDDGTVKADYPLSVNPGETGKAVPDAEGINTDLYTRTGTATVDYATAPELVTVTYTRKTATFTVKYVNNAGAEISSEQMTKNVGENVTLNAKTIDGYIANEASKTFDVVEGQTDVTFTYATILKSYTFDDESDLDDWIADYGLTRYIENGVMVFNRVYEDDTSAATGQSVYIYPFGGLKANVEYTFTLKAMIPSTSFDEGTDAKVYAFLKEGGPYPSATADDCIDKWQTITFKYTPTTDLDYSCFAINCEGSTENVKISPIYVDDIIITY